MLKRLLPLALLMSCLSACAPLVVGGAMVGGALVATDRRSAGMQLEDQSIELKTSLRLREQLADRVHINVNSHNRVVLLTGEAKDEARRNGSTLPVTALVDQFYAEVQAMGGGRWDTSSLIKRLKR